MSYLSKVGSFNIDTANTVGQTQAITGVGFQPKIVLFWWSGSTATGDSVAGGTINIGFGAAISSSSRFCVNGYSLDAGASASSHKKQDTSSCIYIYADGTPTIDGIMDFSSMDAGGFTLIVDDQFASAYRISYLALGGDDLTNVFIGNKQSPNSTGEYSVTGVGFQPDVAIITNTASATLDGDATSLAISFGMAIGSSNQGVIAAFDQHLQPTSNTTGYGYNGEIDAIVSTSVIKRESFVSFGSDGFTLNNLEGTTQYYLNFICLKGGQYSVGDITTRTDGNDIAETVGFQPIALLFASANRALSTQDVKTDHARISIGAATSTSNRAVQAISDEDNLADTETAYANYDTAVYAHVKDDAIEALMDLKSIESDGFTCVMDDTETAGCWVTYLAIGATAETVSEAPICWGHDTGVTETARDFSGNWTGTGDIENSGDSERIRLDRAEGSTGEYMVSEVVHTGAKYIQITTNKYAAGDSVVVKYRHGATSVACQAAEWNSYSVAFESLGYVQVRLESTS